MNAWTSVFTAAGVNACLIELSCRSRKNPDRQTAAIVSWLSIRTQVLDRSWELQYRAVPQRQRLWQSAKPNDLRLVFVKLQAITGHPIANKFEAAGEAFNCFLVRGRWYTDIQYTVHCDVSVKILNGGAKCRKWDSLGWLGGTRGYRVTSTFDTVHTTSYSTLVEAMRRSCSVFEI